MRIHLATLLAASLFVLLGPRPRGGQALSEGIPLGDLVRPKGTTTAGTSSRPEVPSERTPTISQLTPPMGGTPSSSSTTMPEPSSTTTPGASSTSTGTTSGATIGTPSGSVGGVNTPGVNLANPGLPQTTPYSSTVGGVGSSNPLPPTGTPSTLGGSSSTTGATNPSGLSNERP